MNNELKVFQILSFYGIQKIVKGLLSRNKRNQKRADDNLPSFDIKQWSTLMVNTTIIHEQKRNKDIERSTSYIVTQNTAIYIFVFLIELFH